VDPFRQINAALWAAQPPWMKLLLIVVALPAWLVIGYGIFTGRLDQRTVDAAAIIIAVAAIGSTVFIISAFWQNKI
jgi:uncharacterized membrane protein